MTARHTPSHLDTGDQGTGTPPPVVRVRALSSPHHVLSSTSGGNDDIHPLNEKTAAKLTAGHRVLIRGLFGHQVGRIDATLLVGGWSGALVVECVPYDTGSKPLERCVAKLDPKLEDILREQENTKLVREYLRENAPRVHEFTVEFEMPAKDGAPAQWGGLLLELCGAAWTLPGFVASEHEAGVQTFSSLYKNEVADRSATLDREASLVHIGSADADAQPAAATVLPLLDEVLGSIMKTPSCEHGEVIADGRSLLLDYYELPKTVEKHVTTGRKARIEKKLRHPDAQAYAAGLRASIDLDAMSGRQPGEVAALFARLAKLDRDAAAAIERPWFEGRFVHGDLNGANILVDSEEVAWVIDFATLAKGHSLMDLAKLESIILFEYTTLRDEDDLADAVRLSTALAGAPTLGVADLPLTFDPPLRSPALRFAWTAVRRVRSYAPMYATRETAAWVGQMNAARLHWAMWSLSLREVSTLQRRYALETAIVETRFLLRDQARHAPRRLSLTRTVSEEQQELHARERTFEERLYRRHIRHKFQAFVDPISREPIKLLEQCVNLKIVESKVKKPIQPNEVHDVEEEVATRAAPRLTRQASAMLPTTAPPLLSRQSRSLSWSGRGSARDGLRPRPEQTRFDKKIAERKLLPDGIDSGADTRLVVLGSGGYGKTCLLKKLAVLAATRDADLPHEGGGGGGGGDPPRELVPLFVAAVALARLDGPAPPRSPGDAPPSLLDVYLDATYGRGSARWRMLRAARDDGSLLLLVDGLDEAAAQLERVQAWVLDVARASPGTRVYVSTRPAVFAEELFRSAGFKVLRVAPLSRALVTEAVELRLRGFGAATSRHVLDALQKTPAYMDMASVPLMLSLLVFALRDRHRVTDEGDPGRGADVAAELSPWDIFDIGITEMLIRSNLKRRARRRHGTDHTVADQLAALASPTCRRFIEEMAWTVLEDEEKLFDFTEDDMRHVARHYDATNDSFVGEGGGGGGDSGITAAAVADALLANVTEGHIPLFEWNAATKTMRIAHQRFQEHLAAVWLARAIEGAIADDKRTGQSNRKSAALLEMLLPSERMKMTRIHASVFALVERGGRGSNDSKSDGGDFADAVAECLLNHVVAKREDGYVFPAKGDPIAVEHKQSYRYDTIIAVRTNVKKNSDDEVTGIAKITYDTLEGVQERLTCFGAESDRKMVPRTSSVRLDRDDAASVLLRAAAAAGARAALVGLLRRGVVPHGVDAAKKEGPLHLAARNGRSEIARILVERAGANCYVKNANGITPFQLAVSGKHTGVCRIFSPTPGDVDANAAREADGEVPLLRAARLGDVAVVRQELAKEPPPSSRFRRMFRSSRPVTGATGMTALMWAAREGHVDVIRAILEIVSSIGEKRAAGTDTPLLDDVSRRLRPWVDRASNGGYSALHFAADHGHVEAVRALIDAGADPAQLDKANKNTALMFASQFGHVKVVRALLDKSINTSTQNKFGGTALMCASMNGHVEVARALLDEALGDAAADPAQQNESGHTALMLASEYGHVEVARALLDADADPAQHDKAENTALIWASQNGSVEAVRALLDHAGTDVAHQNKNESTALMFASENGHVKAVRALLDAGADVARQTKDGKTALMYACENGHADAVRALFDHVGPDASRDLVSHQTKKGYTALMFACKGGHIEAVRVLLEKCTRADVLRRIGFTWSDFQSSPKTTCALICLTFGSILLFVKLIYFFTGENAEDMAYNNAGTMRARVISSELRQKGSRPTWGSLYSRHPISHMLVCPFALFIGLIATVFAAVAAYITIGLLASKKNVTIWWEDAATAPPTSADFDDDYEDEFFMLKAVHTWSFLEFVVYFSLIAYSCLFLFYILRNVSRVVYYQQCHSRRVACCSRLGTTCTRTQRQQLPV